MSGKHVSTQLQNLMLKLNRWLGHGGRFLPKHHISNDERPGDGVLSHPDKRHPNPRVPVDHGFYFLGMDLKAPNIDHSISSPHEIIAVTPQF